MAKLRDYIAEVLRDTHAKNKIDWFEEADLVMERMLDPNWNPVPTGPKKNSTKCDSYQMFLMEYPSAVHRRIFKCISEAHEPISRQDIADDLCIRLSTVCGRVAELIDSDVIRRDNKKVDPSTKRMVETLVPVVAK